MDVETIDAAPLWLLRDWWRTLRADEATIERLCLRCEGEGLVGTDGKLKGEG